MPHMPYEKSKMIDITRDKPIKISVRVVVPTKDHPKVRKRKKIHWTCEIVSRLRKKQIVVVSTILYFEIVVIACKKVFSFSSSILLENCWDRKVIP